MTNRDEKVVRSELMARERDKQSDIGANSDNGTMQFQETAIN